jgi:hypothetical protein
VAAVEKELREALAAWQEQPSDAGKLALAAKLRKPATGRKR